MTCYITAAGCSVVFWTNESEKQDTTTFCTNLRKKERVSIYAIVM